MNREAASTLRMVETLFDVRIDRESVAPIERTYSTHLLSLQFRTTTQQHYFLKEFDRPSPDHIQQVSAALEPIRASTPQLIFPLATRQGAYYFQNDQGQTFQLQIFRQFRPFTTRHIPLDRLLNHLSALHRTLNQCNLPPHPHGDITDYIVYGVRRIQQQYGADLPFLPQLLAFADHMRTASLPEGACHGDIQASNLGLVGDEILVLDCDEMHWGHSLLDYIQATVEYLDPMQLQTDVTQGRVNLLRQHVGEQAGSLTMRDLRYLLARTLLGPLQVGDWQPQRDAVITFLQELETFCEAPAPT